MTDREKLEAMLANDQEPILDVDTIDQLLADHLVPDQDGLYVADSRYVTTYDLNAAAAAGWRLKAGRVATDYNIQIEGRTLSRGAMIENFLKLADSYSRKRGISSVSLDRRLTRGVLPRA